jgi:membrane protein implicated in regulation of membrane protease activity
MTLLLNPSVWLVAGIVLILAELIIPGGIVVFLGLAALIVAGAVSFGFVMTWMNALTLFFVTSLALVITLRAFFMRYAGGDFSRGNIVEILDDLGQRVPVIKTIGPGQHRGLIDYNGTRWKALGDGQKIEAGSEVQIVGLSNVTYIVEPIPPTPSPNNE